MEQCEMGGLSLINKLGTAHWAIAVAQLEAMNYGPLIRSELLYPESRWGKCINSYRFGQDIEWKNRFKKFAI